MCVYPYWFQSYKANICGGVNANENNKEPLCSSAMNYEMSLVTRGAGGGAAAGKGWGWLWGRTGKTSCPRLGELTLSIGGMWKLENCDFQ